MEALRVELLDGDHHAGAGLGRIQRLLIHPSLVHPPEPTLAEHAIRAEAPGGAPELREGEDPQVGHLQDPPLLRQRQRHRLLRARAAAGGPPERRRAAAEARQLPGRRQAAAAAAGLRRRRACAKDFLQIRGKISNIDQNRENCDSGNGDERNFMQFV